MTFGGRGSSPQRPCPSVDRQRLRFLQGPAFNQYGPQGGSARLRAALSRLAAQGGMSYDADSQVLVTTSGTEGLFAVCQALLNPGDRVVVLMPAFPWYAPCVRMAGAEVVPVQLRAEDGFRIDWEELEQALGLPGVRMVIVNTPHNPTGAVLRRDDAEHVAALCRAREGLSSSTRTDRARATRRSR